MQNKARLVGHLIIEKSDNMEYYAIYSSNSTYKVLLLTKTQKALISFSELVILKGRGLYNSFNRNRK